MTEQPEPRKKTAAKKGSEPAAETAEQSAGSAPAETGHGEHAHVHGPECDHDHDHDHEHDHGESERAISIDARLLAADAKAKIEEETGKPVEDLLYTVTGEEAMSRCRVKVKVEAPAEVFKNELEKYYQEVRKDIALPGFRKGKAPVKLIRIRLGKDGDKDAVSEVAANILRQEVAKRGLTLVDNARVPVWSAEEGQPLTFEAILESETKIELKEYTGLTAKVTRLEVTDEMVSKRLDQMREDWVTWENAPEGATLEHTDQATVDVRVTGQGGKELPHLNRDDQRIRSLNELPPEVAEKLAGAKVGDTIEADVTSSFTNRRGEEVERVDHHTVTLKAILRKTLPTLDDEFAKDMEAESLDALKANVRKNLEAEVDRNRRNLTLNKTIEAIIEKNAFEVPDSHVRNVQYRAVLEHQRQLDQYGIDLAHVVPDLAAYLKQRETDAEFQVKAVMVVQEIARRENLEVGEDDLTKEIERMAEESGRKPLAIRARLEAEQRLDQLRAALRDKKVEEFLLSRNKVEEVEPETKPEEKAEDKPEA